MHKTKRNVLIVCLVSFVLSLVVALLLINSTTIAKAEETENTEILNYTLVTNEDGESSYKVAVRPVLRTSVNFIRIPDSYNGLPVTEIAANGFASCTKLTNVILPNTIVTIGNNAFLNCSNLRTLSLPNVKNIGSSAFALCPNLTHLYFPDSVESVGTNILRSNPNPIYIQNSASAIKALWEDSWNGYYTGEVHFNADAADAIRYYEIFDSSKVLIGYGISAYQAPSDEVSDLVLYNAIRTEENSNYLPVLNIDSTAFTGLYYNSISIKDVHEVDPNAPDFNSKINICSEAFYDTQTMEINIEVAVEFEHEKYSEQLKQNPSDNSIIETDLNNNSTKVFAESYILQRITLPYDLEMLPQQAFLNCTLLSEIRIAGQEYIGTNVLPNIKKIGSEAFSSCGNLLNISIPSSVEEMGENVFYEWGNGGNEQTIHIDLYEDEIPEKWKSNFIENSNLKVEYKPLITVYLHYQDEKGTVKEIGVRHNAPMPKIEKPVREGYIFKGVYSGENGTGLQFYTDELVSARNWDTSYKNDLYVYWARSYSKIIFDNIEYTTEINNVEYGQTLPAVEIPKREGYKFEGYYFIEEDETKTYYYNSAMGPLRNWDRTIDTVTLHSDWSLIEYSLTYKGAPRGDNPEFYTIETETIVFADPVVEEGYIGKWDPESIPKGTTGDKEITAIISLKIYSIKYDVSDWKGNENPNPNSYTIEDEVVFIKLEALGYTFEWIPSSLPKETRYDQTIIGVWTPIEYNINYVVYSNTVHSNPSTYTIEQEIIFTAPVRGGYFAFWDKERIPKGTTGDVTVTASYIEKTLDQCYNNGVYEIYTWEQFDQLHTQPNSGAGRTYVLMNKISVAGYHPSAIWEVMPEFRGTLDGNGYYISSFSINYSLEDHNIGLFGINYGIIRNLTLGTSMGSTNALSGVYMGIFCGINENSIYNCNISIVVNRPNFTFNPNVSSSVAESYAGAYAGRNNGTISNCHKGLAMRGSSNMGGIVGINYGEIIGCSNDEDIDYDYRDYNASVGGIVAVQASGTIRNCHYSGRVILYSYQTNTNVSYFDNRELQPNMGIIAGYKKGGDMYANSWESAVGTLTGENVVAFLPLNVVTWETGSLWWKETHVHDQGLYFKNAECGRID